MQLTNQSKYMIQEIKKENEKDMIDKLSIETRNILYPFYKDISQAYEQFNELFQYLNKMNLLETYFDIHKIKMASEEDIIFPKQFSVDSFPVSAINEINRSIKFQLCYRFEVSGRQIIVYIGAVSDMENISLHSTLEKIIMWLEIASKYASHKCSNKLTLYLYLTDLKKELPHNKKEILDWEHVNTAFTRSCMPESEIIIYRKEEWFKVFIHETFHCFGLDFSQMDNTNTKSMIRNLYHVNSEVNLYEAYVEYWAEVWNILFFVYIDDEYYRKDWKKYIKMVEELIQYEKIHSIHQMNKILSHMELDYRKLISFDVNKLADYKENTNILAYYIIKTILYYHFNETIEWCSQNNGSNIFQFSNTKENQESLCEFIETMYKNPLMLDHFEKKEKISKSKSKSKTESKLKTKYNMNNLQMGLFDLI